VAIKTSAFNREIVRTIATDQMLAVKINHIADVVKEEGKDPSLTLRLGGTFATLFGDEQIKKFQEMNLQVGDFVNMNVMPGRTVTYDKRGDPLAPRLVRVIDIEKGTAPNTDLG
jgi:hypothetical protein